MDSSGNVPGGSAAPIPAIAGSPNRPNKRKADQDPSVSPQSSPRRQASQESSRPSIVLHSNRRIPGEDEDLDDPSSQDQPSRDGDESLPPITAREIKGLGHPSKPKKGIQLPATASELEEAKQAVRDTKTEWAKTLEQYGFTALVDNAHYESMNAGHPFKEDTPSRMLSAQVTWRLIGVPMLAGSPLFLIERLLQGFISSIIKKDKDPEIVSLYQADGDNAATHSPWIQRYNEPFAPCIYVRELVSANTGESPTARELRQVIKTLREYASGDPKFHKQNAQIDRKAGFTSDPDDISRGYHHFLRGSRNRLSSLHTFCFALERRLRMLHVEPDADPDRPLDLPLRYVGYSESAKQIFTGYNANTHSSWLCQTVEAVCRYLFKDKYILDQHVVCFLCKYEECQLGEELFTVMTMAYHDTGYGFGVAFAGLSVQSANLDHLQHGQVKKMWQNCHEFRYKGPYIRPNVEREGKKSLAYNAYLKSIDVMRVEQERLAALQARLAELKKKNAQIVAETEEMRKKKTPPEELLQGHKEMIDAEKKFLEVYEGLPEYDDLRKICRQNRKHCRGLLSRAGVKVTLDWDDEAET